MVKMWGSREGHLESLCRRLNFNKLWLVYRKIYLAYKDRDRRAMHMLRACGRVQVHTQLQGR